MNLLVSIIIPNFNKEKYISETLDSIVLQSYSNWEVIVVDDSSIDNSLRIINKYCKEDKRFRLIERKIEPKGGSICRNIGLNNANGDLIIFLDSDDIFVSTTLEARVNIFKQYINMDFIVFNMGTFKEAIGDHSSAWRPKKYNHLKRFISHDLQWSIMSPIWKKEFLLELGGFDEEYPRLQDVELHTRALLHKDVSYKVFPKTSSDCYYRIDEERIVYNYDEFMLKVIIGASMYICKISELVRNDETFDTHKLLKSLKGTLLSFINRVLYAHKQSKISMEHKNMLIDELLKNANDSKILSSFDNIFIRWYIKAYEFGLYKVKGFNYISKKLAILI